MGVLIPLFQKKDTAEEDLLLSQEQRMRIKLIHNSIEALKKEETAIETTITQKCKEEIERLRIVDMKLRQLEGEAQNIRKAARTHVTLPGGK